MTRTNQQTAFDGVRAAWVTNDAAPMVRESTTLRLSMDGVVRRTTRVPHTPHTVNVSARILQGTSVMASRVASTMDGVWLPTLRYRT